MARGFVEWCKEHDMDASDEAAVDAYREDLIEDYEIAAELED